jgi:hypothetical protein
MKCLYWNVRGLANSPTKLALKNLITINKPDFSFISEPWMNLSRISQSWWNRLGLKVFAVNSRNNLLPNMWCAIFGFTAVYASTYYLSRRSLWTNITSIQTQHPIPWCCIGDFNTILGAQEHKGSTTPARTPMLDFQDWSNSNNLLHLPTQRAFYTWSNGRRGRHATLKRLDRAICNIDWINACSTVKVSTLTKLRSDHFPILLEFKNQDIHVASNFKFMKMWIAHPDCINIIKQSWNSNFTGCPMFILNQKLKKVKENLKVWNKSVFGNIHSNVKNATAKVDSIQQDIDTFGPTDDLIDQERLAKIDLENVLNMDEIFWKEKAKVKWHCDGERNTAYFHRLAKIRNTTNLITSLKHGESTLTDPNDISAHVVDHFSNLFNHNSNVTDNGIIEEVIHNLLTDRINNMLCMLPSHGEIHNAVFSLNKDSAPGSDGFGAFFFKLIGK